MEKDNLENRAEPSEFQLIKGDARKYYGKYVAFVPPNPKNIIASGNTPLEAKREAKNLGITEPHVEYFPHPDEEYALEKA